MQPFIQIFGLAISAAPAAVWLGFVLAIWVAGRTAAWRGLNGGALGDALTVAGFAAGFDRLVALGPQEIQVGMLKRLRGDRSVGPSPEPAPLART